MSRATPTMVMLAPPGSTRTTSPRANPASASFSLATASSAPSGSRPLMSVVGSPGLPSWYPKITASVSSPSAVTVNVA